MWRCVSLNQLAEMEALQTTLPLSNILYQFDHDVDLDVSTDLIL